MSPTVSNTPSNAVDSLSPNKILDLPIVFADDMQSTASADNSTSSSPSATSQSHFKKVIIAKKPNFTITSSKVLRPANTPDSSQKPFQKNIKILPMTEKAIINLNKSTSVTKITGKAFAKVVGTANSLTIVNTKKDGVGGSTIIRKNNQPKIILDD